MVDENQRTEGELADANSSVLSCIEIWELRLQQCTLCLSLSARGLHLEKKLKGLFE